MRRLNWFWFALAVMLSACSGRIESEENMYNPLDDEHIGAAQILKAQCSARGLLRMRTQVGAVITPASTNTQVGMQCPLSRGVNTVQFSIDPIFNPAALGKRSAAIATVLWSVDGNTIKRRLSMLPGTSISGSADAVQVIMEDDTRVNPAPPAGVLLDYNVGCQVSEGVRAGAMPPVLVPEDNAAGTWFSGKAIVNAGAGSAFLAIPNDAGIVSVSAMISSNTGVVIPDNSVVVQQVSGTTIVVREYDPRYGDSFVPLHPFASNIHVLNYGAAQISVYILWGIDG